MIDLKTGVEVIVKPFGSAHPYDEHEALPNSPLYAHGRNERYIEAVAGQRYAIKVIVRPSFNMKRERNLRICYSIDGQIHFEGWIGRPVIGKGVLIPLKTHEATSFVSADGPESHELFTCGFTFEDVETSDDSTMMTLDEEAVDLQKRGKTQASIQRGGSSVRRRGHYVREYQAPLIDLVTKCVSFENGRSHYTEFIVIYTKLRLVND